MVRFEVYEAMPSNSSFAVAAVTIQGFSVMHSLHSWSRWLLLIVLLVAGCNSKPDASTAQSTEDGEVSSPEQAGAKPKKKIVPVKRDVKELVGNWVVVVTNQRVDNYRWIIKFSRGEGDKVTAEFLDTHQDKDENSKPKILETVVDGDAIRIVMENAKSKFDFIGSFQDGFVRGTIRTSPVELFLTRMLPTDEKSLEPFGATGLPPGSDAIEAKIKSKSLKPDDLLVTVREFRTSPAVQDIYAMILANHAQAGFDEAKLKEVINDFVSSAKLWGDRWLGRAEMTVGVNLINGRLFPQLALPYFDAAEQHLGEDLDLLKSSIAAYRDAAHVQIWSRQLMSESTPDDERTKAAAGLTEIVAKQPFNSEVLLALATHAERTGNADQAIEYLTDIVALPLLEATILQLRAGEPPNSPTPHEVLKKLWNQKHGNEDGYDKRLLEVYHQKIGALLTEVQAKIAAPPAVDAGNRTVLVELFTGMQCPPCVAADLAVEALSKTYPTSEVVVVRYHQHIPGPDGLANQDSEERGAFYNLSATPTVVVDGMMLDPRYYSGLIQSTPNGYALFRQVIDERLAMKTDVALKLSAKVTDGQLAVEVEATGIPEDILPSCRLRMAIVENKVQTFWPLGSNGIFEHEFVARESLDGSKGIPPKKGELKYAITMPLSDIQDHLTHYISQFEAGRRTEFPAQLKPSIKSSLSLVAWVQNGTVDKELQSRLVLQSALIPIEGTDVAAPVESAANPIATEPKSDTQPAETPAATSATPETKSETSPAGNSESVPPAPDLPE